MRPEDGRAEVEAAFLDASQAGYALAEGWLLCLSDPREWGGGWQERGGRTWRKGRRGLPFTRTFSADDINGVGPESCISEEQRWLCAALWAAAGGFRRCGARGPKQRAELL